MAYKVDSLHPPKPWMWFRFIFRLNILALFILPIWDYTLDYPAIGFILFSWFFAGIEKNAKKQGWELKDQKIL